jgi:hypothetical protein
MKKFLSLAVLVIATGSAVFALDIEPKDMINFAKMVQGKTFKMSPELMSEWLDYKAGVFRLAAREVDALADQIKNPMIADQYYDLSQNLRHLSSELWNLPIPDQALEKNVKHMPAWLLLKAKKAGLMAREFKFLAGQITNKGQKEKLLEKAKDLQKWSDELKGLLRAEFKERVQEFRSRVSERMQGVKENIRERVAALKQDEDSDPMVVVAEEEVEGGDDYDKYDDENDGQDDLETLESDNDEAVTEIDKV